MRKYSHISIDRQVVETEAAARLTAKINHHANEAFGHDGSTIIEGDITDRNVGNPLFDVLRPLYCNLLYRAATINGRNKSSSFRMAEDRLERIAHLEDRRKGLYRKYDGIDANLFDVWFDLPILGSKPGYNVGEAQFMMPPMQSSIEAGLLLEEAQVCAAALAEAAPRVGLPETPVFPGIPLIRVHDNCPTERREDFIDRLRESGVFPVRLTLGEFSIDASDRSVRSQPI